MVATKSVRTVEASWRHHEAARTAREVAKAAQIYADDAVIRLYEQGSGRAEQQTIFKGPQGARDFLTWLFGAVGTSDLSAPVCDVDEATDGSNGHVFRVWQCPSAGIKQCSDTYLFDGASKVTRHNTVVCR
eukprot:TRINITY_DN11804_c0_g1_i2.p1 TRINITY_DN11804_c0_g1~~TRINITY_DN11804_c0_g1_i2.p1  ORF type:complete len:147 (+),score=39.44 TRINITY_DN11804_c0_g1_i2:51-443(+)